ncbi:hypothetical protein G6F68_011008 [Rhizopus microsporus]|nr:hypothetical protein G6F68_011008 [Rhizopus microsporus]
MAESSKLDSTLRRASASRRWSPAAPAWAARPAAGAGHGGPSSGHRARPPAVLPAPATRPGPARCRARPAATAGVPDRHTARWQGRLSPVHHR